MKATLRSVWVTRRSLLGMGVIVAGGIVGAACGAVPAATPAAEAPKSAEKPAAAPAKAAEPVTLVWMVEGYDLGIKTQEEGAKIFEAKNPNIKLKQVNFQSQSDYLNQWLAGAGPDLTTGWDSDFIGAGRSGLLLPLDNYIKKDSQAVPLEDYITGQIKAYQYPSVGLFALPATAAVDTLHYHKVLFQNAGLEAPDATWDWNKYREALRKLTNSAAQQWGGLLPPQLPAYTMMLLLGNGANLVDPQDDRKAAFASEKGLQALQWAYDLMWKDRSLLTRAEFTKLTGQQHPHDALGTGKVATLQYVSQSIPVLAQRHPNAVDTWDVAMVPTGPARRVMHVYTDAWGINKATKVADAAWELMKFLQSAAWLEIWIKVAAAQPPRLSLQDRYVTLTKQNFPALANKKLESVAEAVKKQYVHAREFFRKDADSWKIYTTAWNATIVNNEKSLVDTFRDAAKQIDALNAGS
jgi:multiple sugar transport system substrate-binding protein